MSLISTHFTDLKDLIIDEQTILIGKVRAPIYDIIIDLDSLVLAHNYIVAGEHPIVFNTTE